MLEGAGNLHHELQVNFYDDFKDVAIARMKDLINQATSGAITMLSIREHESSSGMEKLFEVAYVETDSCGEACHCPLCRACRGALGAVS